MAEYLQFLGMVFTAADVLVTAARRVGAAKGTLREISDRATHVKAFLRISKGILEDLSDEYKPMISVEEYESLVNDIVSTIERCERTLKETFGLWDDKGKLCSEATVVDRLKVAARHDRIRGDRDKLESLEEQLHRSLWAVKTRLKQIKTRRDRASEGNSDEVFQRSLRELDGEVEKSSERVRNWQVGVESDDPATQPFVEDDLENTILTGITRSLEDRADTYAKQEPQPVPTTSSSGLFREGGLSRGSSMLPMTELSPSDSEIFAQLQSRRELALKDENERTKVCGAGVETLEALTEIINVARKAAIYHVAAQNWKQAEVALAEVAECSERRKELHGIAFENQFQVHEDLAIVYLRQSKWAEALREIPQTDWCADPGSNGGNKNNAEPAVSDQDLKARSLQLCALIHYDRYCKRSDEQSAHDPDRARDLDQAKDLALEAFGIHEELVRTLASQPDLQQHCECLRLLVRVYEALEKPYREGYYRQKLDQKSKHVYGPKSRRDTDRTEIIDSFDLEDPGRKLVLEAVQTGQRERVETLFAAVTASDTSLLAEMVNSEQISTDLNAEVSEGWTLLTRAVSAGHLDVVHFLLTHDANPDGLNDNSESPLLIAVKYQYKEIAQELVNQGANVKIVDEDGWSLLHHAVHNDTTVMTSFLMKAAPSLKEARDDYGKTALHHCAENGGDSKMYSHAKVLLSSKADVNADDYAQDQARTPLYLAGSQPYTPERDAMVKLLLDHQANVDSSRLPTHGNDYPCLRERVSKRSES